MSDEHQESTLRPSHGWALAASVRAAALTVLYHPSVGRVGELARLTGLLDGKPVELSRSKPSFAHPGTSGGAPLGDRHLSRSPIRLIPAPEGAVTIAPGGSDCLLDGAPLSGPRTLSWQALEAGVVLELASRVVLLLHAVGLPGPKQPALGMIGASEPIERLRAEILRVSRFDVPVLIRGESGAGKELVARSVAAQGTRARGPFVAVNLAAVPPTLAASQLFGHASGAYTGAEARHEGYFARAHGGTLFLDEVAAAPLEVQAMLLRALETREIQPLGSGRTQAVDVRVLSATDGDLELARREGAFRDALYHRLAGYALEVPPLRARRDDVGRLLFHFLRTELEVAGAERRLDDLERSSPWLPASLVARLAGYAWPGNVRELANVARRLAVAAVSGEVAREALLPAEILAPPPEPAEPDPAAPVTRAADLDEEKLIAVLRSHRFRVGAAARALGVSRTTLYARIDASERIRKARDLGEAELRQAHGECGGDLERMAERLEVSSRGLALRLGELGLR